MIAIPIAITAVLLLAAAGATVGLRKGAYQVSQRPGLRTLVGRVVEWEV